MPKRESNASVHVSGASAHRRPPTRPSPAAPPARPKTRPSLAVRRRRTLLAVASVTLLSFLLTLTGVIGWPLQLVVDLILVAFVVHLRTQAKRAAAVTRQRRRAAVAPPAPRPAYARSGSAVRSAPAVPVAPDERVTAPMQPVEPLVAEAAATGTDDRWQPVPVPPPTYTMKPKAPQRWTYVRPDAPAAAPAAAVEAEPEEQPLVADPAEPAEVGELDGILEHRWAVND
jgi:predicted lipid-binding transport protein (Tim44 family)